MSYDRAYALYNYWLDHGIDFYDKKFENIVDMHIAGNGIGGVGRMGYGHPSNSLEERKNQRFLINIIPKIECDSCDFNVNSEALPQEVIEIENAN